MAEAVERPPLSARVEVVDSADKIPEGTHVVAMPQGGVIARGWTVGWRVIEVFDDGLNEPAINCGIPSNPMWQVVGLVPACGECWGQGLQTIVDPFNPEYLRFVPERCLMCGGTGERSQH